MRQDCNEVQTELLIWIWKFKSELCLRKANCQFLRRNVYPFHVFFTYDLPTPDYKSNLKYLHLNFNYFFCVATQDRSIEPGQRSPQLEECINAVWSCKQANVFALIIWLLKWFLLVVLMLELAWLAYIKSNATWSRCLFWVYPSRYLRGSCWSGEKYDEVYLNK